MNKLIAKINKEQSKRRVPKFRVGDTLRVQVKIVEGDKERLQAYTGTVIARKGSGVDEMVRVRRISFGEGVERVFPLQSPRIERIEVLSVGDTRRAKLYYLRERQGKHGKIQQSRVEQDAREISQTEAPSQDVSQANAAAPDPVPAGVGSVQGDAKA